MATHDSTASQPYAVFPTQDWTVCEPAVSLEHIQPPAANGAAALDNYVYLFTRTSDDQMYAQRILVETCDSGPWVTLLQGVPIALADGNGISLRSQAPPAAFSSNGLIFLIFSGADEDNRLFMCRYNGASGSPGTISDWAPFTMVFGDQSVAPGRPPCVATIDDKVFLAWPGSGFNGFFYSIGTIGAPDDFGVTITWSGAQVIPGTESWVRSDIGNQASVMAFRTGTSSGFVFFSDYLPPPGPPAFAYAVYDNGTGSFTSTGPINFPLVFGLDLGYAATGCTMIVADDMVVPVLVDQTGNITYYQLDAGAPNYGGFADWLQCSMSGGGGGDIGVSVGIPPSISVSGEIDTDPDPAIAGMTIYPGTDGGALICGQFYDPFLGNNYLGFSAVALNFGTFTPR